MSGGHSLSGRDRLSGGHSLSGGHLVRMRFLSSKRPHPTRSLRSEGYSGLAASARWTSPLEHVGSVCAVYIAAIEAFHSVSSLTVVRSCHAAMTRASLLVPVDIGEYHRHHVAISANGRRELKAHRVEDWLDSAEHVVLCVRIVCAVGRQLHHDGLGRKVQNRGRGTYDVAGPHVSLSRRTGCSVPIEHIGIERNQIMAGVGCEALAKALPPVTAMKFHRGTSESSLPIGDLVSRDFVDLAQNEVQRPAPEITD